MGQFDFSPIDQGMARSPGAVHIRGMAVYGDLTPGQWEAIRSMGDDGVYPVDGRIAAALIRAGLAERVIVQGSRQMACKLTDAGRELYGRRHSKSQP